MFQTKARGLVFLVVSSLSVTLACSSSTDGGATNSGGSTRASNLAGSVASASTTGASGGAGAGGGSTLVATSSGGAGAVSSSTTQSSGGSRQPSSTGGVAGRSSTASGGTAEGGRSASGGASAGSMTGGNTASGGTIASSVPSSTASAGSGGSRTSSGGPPNSGGSSSSTGGATSTTGTTGPSDPLCPSGITRNITVAKDGSGQFSTVQAAVNSITSGSKDPIRIDIKAGTYTEKLTIASRTNLCLVGASATTTILAYGDSNSSTGGTSTSASVHISADDFSAANLTFQNTFGAGSQAVALRTTGNRQQFLNCRFVGYQDTLYTHNGSQYFKNCYVQGNTDFVFGGATAVLQNCEVRNVQSGSAVAAPNTDAARDYGIVFMGGKFTAASGVSGVALGRPWGADGFAAYLNVELGSHISAAGFVAMSGNQPQGARFHEYGSTGSGANAGSRSSYQLTAAQAANYTLAKIFGTWTPTYSQ